MNRLGRKRILLARGIIGGCAITLIVAIINPLAWERYPGWFWFLDVLAIMALSAVSLTLLDVLWDQSDDLPTHERNRRRLRWPFRTKTKLPEIYTRAIFQGALDYLDAADRYAVQTDLEYHRRGTASPKDRQLGTELANMLITSWDIVNAAKRRLARLYWACFDEAQTLNTRLNELIRADGPDGPEVEAFRHHELRSPFAMEVSP